MTSADVTGLRLTFTDSMPKAELYSNYFGSQPLPQILQCIQSKISGIFQVEAERRKECQHSIGKCQSAAPSDLLNIDSGWINATQNS
jgi:hypothetical protein